MASNPYGKLPTSGPIADYSYNPGDVKTKNSGAQWFDYIFGPKYDENGNIIPSKPFDFIQVPELGGVQIPQSQTNQYQSQGGNKLIDIMSLLNQSKRGRGETGVKSQYNPVFNAYIQSLLDTNKVG